MSLVTNVIVTVGVLEEEEDGPGTTSRHVLIDRVNDWLGDNGQGGLARVDQHAGGVKAMEANVYLGAFNYLPLEEFLDFIKEQPWKHPDELQVWVQEQEEDVFRLV